MQSFVISADTINLSGYTPELKNYLRIDPSNTNDDYMLQQLALSVFSFIEGYCHISINNRLLEVSFTEAVRGKLILPYAPVNAVNSITAMYQDQSVLLIPNTDYFIKGNSNNTIIQFNNVQRYFSTSQFIFDELIIQYQVGSNQVMQYDMKLAFFKLIAESYEKRENTILDFRLTGLPFDAKACLNRYRVANWF